jgi:hypothetical protein
MLYRVAILIITSSINNFAFSADTNCNIFIGINNTLEVIPTSIYSEGELIDITISNKLNNIRSMWDVTNGGFLTIEAIYFDEDEDLGVVSFTVDYVKSAPPEDCKIEESKFRKIKLNNENEHDFMNWLEAQTHVTNIPSKGAVVYAYTDMNSNGLHEVWLESVTNHGDPYFSIYEERKNGGYKKISSGQ